MLRRILNISIFVSAVLVLFIASAGFHTFNYFYLYGHIESFADFIFCVLQWVKLAGLAVIAISVFMKSGSFSVVLKYLYILLPLLSLFWADKYFSFTNMPSGDEEQIYYNINSFMPALLIKILFFAESILMALTAALTALRDGFRPRKEYKSLIYFVPVFAACVPLNIFSNLTGFFSSGVYNFFLFKNFSLWHFASFALLAAAVVFVYRFLKSKNNEQAYRYLSVLAIVLIVQYMSRASMLIGDGYNTYKTIYAFIPLFICNMGVFVAALAVFTKNKILADLAFFVHAPGAFSVFVYFGKESMSNFGTVFDYTFLYFVLTHTALFVLCVIPVFSGRYRFTLKRCKLPFIYFAFFLLTASAASQTISSVDFAYGDTVINIYPNFAFTQNSPIEYGLPFVPLKIFNLKFDILYLSLLYIVHNVIFFAFFGLYHFFIGKRLTAENRKLPKAVLAEALATRTDDGDPQT